MDANRGHCWLSGSMHSSFDRSLNREKEGPAKLQHCGADFVVYLNTLLEITKIIHNS
jgi:hypothetical protein